MFDIGLPEFFVLGVVALLVFGPERLPEVALQAARMVKRLRRMAESARSELSTDLEPHLRELQELRELDPRRLAKNYILDPADEDGTLRDLRKPRVKPATSAANGAPAPAPTPPVATPEPVAQPVVEPVVESVVEPAPPPFDVDAT